MKLGAARSSDHPQGYGFQLESARHNALARIAHVKLFCSWPGRQVLLLPICSPLLLVPNLLGRMKSVHSLAMDRGGLVCTHSRQARQQFTANLAMKKNQRRELVSSPVLEDGRRKVSSLCGPPILRFAHRLW